MNGCDGEAERKGEGKREKGEKRQEENFGREGRS